MTRHFGHAAKKATERRDLHAELTQKIVAQIEAGAGEFKMPWHRPGVAFKIPANALTKARYRGSNILWLWMSADEKKFEHQIFATYKQWQKLGGQVRGGEKGTLIVKYGEWVPKSDQSATPDADDDGKSGKRLYAKPATVFNIDQVDLPPGARSELLPTEVPRADLTERLAHVDAFIAATKAEFREGGQRAFYRHRSLNGEGDFIQMPPRELFTGTETSTPTEAYESTRLHELAHWSGAAHRLDRKHGERFGDNAYAFEELVAELSAAYLSAELEITNVPRPDHAQYISGWLQVLKSDTRAIFSAAAAASTAVDYLVQVQPAEPERTHIPPTIHADQADGP
ncbi:MAG: DUF1738 domain-containing protein [Proteobacteria bacterium]|nr:DUF1738 domain-containing protein [Pseudomonadota bacterium]